MMSEVIKKRFPSLPNAHSDGKMTERNVSKISGGGEQVSCTTGSWKACSRLKAICSPHGQRHFPACLRHVISILRNH